MTNEEKILGILIGLQSDMQDVKGRLTSVEDRLTSVEDRLASVEDRLASVERRLISVEEKMDYLMESQEEVRASLNVLLDWAGRISSIEQLHVPRLDNTYLMMESYVGLCYYVLHKGGSGRDK